ncbi:MAG: hypothetical protein ACK6D3_15705 [Planctomycetaceae bacterium]|jgi:hypothetical protein
MDDDSFLVLSLDEMRKRFYPRHETAPILSLRADKVPEGLRKLIPLAERWGISDDILREEARRQASSAELEYLKAVILNFDDALDEWLAGPEAMLPTQSAEYLAFSNLRMAADGC